ncbi:hypothetical protein BCR44DRAFT_1441331 [Catenaria anguillulae PL171]|uniref:BZIP domain-containing protein n=1 Tax=Catenaria anguillulae PL171 TaxID=765915 RepID=A0A1Y2HBE8_9FUNG|nr:hypothetical protein BCR44DRAFT_1441331 [Catenaria anguillulae PL171]
MNPARLTQIESPESGGASSSARFAYGPSHHAKHPQLHVPNVDGRLSLPANFSCAPPVVASQPESSHYEHVSPPTASVFQHQQPSPVFFSVDHIAIPSATNSIHSAPAIAIPASDSTASLPMDPRAFAALAFPPLIPSTPSSMLVPETNLQDQAVSVLLSPVSGSSSYMPSPAAISAAFPNHGSPSNKPSPPPRSRSASRSSMQYIPILPCSLSPTSSPKELSSNPVRRRHSTTSSSASTSNKPSLADDPIKQARAAAKRQRNTDAARRSRLRRNKRLDELEVRVHELEGRNRELRLRAAVAQADREACQAKEREMKARVAFLEEKMLQVYQSKAAAVQE